MLWSGWLFFNHISYSIQFTGGMEIVVDEPIDASLVTKELTQALQSKSYTNFVVAIGEKDEYDSVLLQIAVDDDEKVNELTQIVNQTLLDTKTISSLDNILESSITGPSIGKYITKTAKNALIRGIILMAFYILFSFAWMRELISPLLLWIVTIITMIFDVSIAAGAYGFLMKMNAAVQIDTIFIIALLTVLWYSVNDTIIIFDRIRENFTEKHTALESGKVTNEEIFEMSLRQTMRRSIATSLSTLLVVFAMYIFGTWILKMFAFTLGIWVMAGTYSSIFLAAPFAYLLSNKSKSKK